MSKLLVTVDHQFVRTPDGKVWVKTIYGHDFWQRYLGVFDQVRVAARVRDEDSVPEDMLLSGGFDDKVEFFPLPQYRGPKEFVLRYRDIQKRVAGVADGCDAALFRIPSPIANLVKKQAVRAGLPWATEIVNDPWDNFAPGTFKSLFRPVYRLHFTHQVRSYAKKANGASYVTQFALQKNYPAYARLHGESAEHFESYYSSIILKDSYFWRERQFDPAKDIFTIAHINSCITDYSKGHDVVIRTAKRLLDRGVNVQVKFIGDGPMREQFAQMAADLGIGERVRFTGLLSGAAAVREELLNSDILIFPTLGEGLPRTVIESMAVGLPCLSTAVNGIPELLAEDDMLPQQDDEAFATRAQQILTDGALYESISRRNIEKAAEYEESVLDERRKVFYGKLFNLTKTRG